MAGKHPDGKCSSGKSETVKPLQTGCIQYRGERDALLIEVLQFGVTGSALSSFYASISFGVQQGSMFSPMLFTVSYLSLYTSLEIYIMVCHADETELKPGDHCRFDYSQNCTNVKSVGKNLHKKPTAKTK